MLENIYTTKMSVNKKQIQNRFTKIRSANSKISKMMSLVMAILVAVTMLCATVVLASVVNEAPEQFKIEVKHGNTVLQLDNKPFVYEGTVFLPLRELFEKIGLMENENSFIQWDNGKIYMCVVENVEKPDYVEYGSEIKYLSYYYGIEIGKAEYILNPPEIMQKKYNFDSSKKTNHAPMLKDGVTYIPFEYVEYLVNRTMQTSDVTCSAWDLVYNENTDRKADYVNDIIGIDYANYYGEFQYDIKGFDYSSEQQTCYEIVRNCFYELQNGNIENMKQYCTENFINIAFSDRNFMGYTTGTVWSIKTISLYADTDYSVIGSFYPNNDFTDESNSKIISVKLKRQNDNTFLIDDVRLYE